MYNYFQSVCLCAHAVCRRHFFGVCECASLPETAKRLFSCYSLNVGRFRVRVRLNGAKRHMKWPCKVDGTTTLSIPYQWLDRVLLPLISRRQQGGGGWAEGEFPPLLWFFFSAKIAESTWRQSTLKRVMRVNDLDVNASNSNHMRSWIILPDRTRCVWAYTTSYTLFFVFLLARRLCFVIILIGQLDGAAVGFVRVDFSQTHINNNVF